MEMDWEALLDELRSYAASDPNELETKIRACLKGHSSEGLLQAVALLISQGQHATARTHLSEFLKSHQAAADIGRRLELILYFKKSRAPNPFRLRASNTTKRLCYKTSITSSPLANCKRLSHSCLRLSIQAKSLTF